MLSKGTCDKNDVTHPHDHSDINAKDWLIRGITQYHIKDNRISSAAFKSSSDPYKGLSVDLKKLGGDRRYPNEKHIGAVQLQSQVPRQRNLLVGYDPVSGNSSHCQIWRYENGPKNITPSQARHMQYNSKWLVEIENVALF